MKIVDTNNVGNTTSAQTGRTGELHSIDRAGKHGSADKSPGLKDSVELSGFTGRLSQTMQDATINRAQRISELTAAVRSGSYQVDAAAVSQAMVNQAISSGIDAKL